MVDQVLTLPSGGKYMLLAPVVKDRKGEHQKLLAELHTQGFIRARIDGEIYELDEPPELDLRKKHSIEVVVDRFKIRDDLALRLAESFETATAMSDGLAIVESLDDENSAQILFSAKFACPHCGYALSELEPQLFSFNNPAGACPSCDGLGVQQFFDPQRVVLQPEQSIPGGAIPGWDRRSLYYHHLLQCLAKHDGADLDLPFNQLPEDFQQRVLYGSGKDVIDFSHTNSRGELIERKHTFEGVLPNMERRYRETESNVVREELLKYMSTRACPSCHGTRLRESARNVFVGERALHQITAMSVEAAQAFFSQLHLEGQRGAIAAKILKEVNDRLGFLVNVGLNYLTLDRSAETLSGGEAQRIRLASQIGAGLVGVMYILDEPSIGLHQRDNDRLLQTLIRLRDLGNSVIVVEHDEDAIRAADYVVDMGPGAGVHGGDVVAHGTPDTIAQHPDSVTGQYLSGRREIAVPHPRHAPQKERWLSLQGASGNNLQRVDLKLPVGLFTCVTGVSGSGKSTLINDTLYKVAATRLNRAHLEAAPYEQIDGLEHFDKVIDIDQSPIGRTPRSNPATYTGIFTAIRELFAGTQEARSRGYKAGRFSFNVKGGRCEACQGDGLIKVEMHFLPDVYVPCDVCHGKRYNRETLDIQYKGKNIHQVLDLTVEDAYAFFNPVPSIARKLKTLMDVGLSYIRLGQSATTLSGGEAQRIKLAKELSKRDTGKTLYILDEPTTGLHFADIELLLQVLHRLRDHGNSIVVIEHNLDVIKTADWIVDLGPEGGTGGGQIIAQGTPEEVALCDASHTGRYLKPYLNLAEASRAG